VEVKVRQGQNLKAYRYNQLVLREIELLEQG
jgi:hypothetical protein